MSSQAQYLPPESAEPNPPAATRSVQDGRVTPMMAQYIEIKAANPDSLLFYRMGDFYELFFGDAEIASQALGIVLTKRGKHLGEDIPMCGVPVERADDYLQRLIGLGHRVAVCEQTEDPAEAKKRGSKSVVRRDVVRLVTPGTITEERLLDPGRANLFLAVARRRISDTDWSYGLAAVDISTGRFTLSATDAAGLAAEIARFEPREILVPDAIHDDPALAAFWRETRAAVTPLSRDGLDPASAERRLKEHFGVATLDAFGSFGHAELAAAGSALFYIEKTQIGSRPVLHPPTRDGTGATLAIDAATRANLELTRTLSGERAGSLLATIDCTVTPGGARLLGERLAGPLTDPAAIRARQDAVEALVENGDLRERLRRILKRSPDFARALSRLGLGRGGPRDLACVRDGLFAARDLGLELAIAPNLPPELSEAAQTLQSLSAGIAHCADPQGPRSDPQGHGAQRSEKWTRFSAPNDALTKEGSIGSAPEADSTLGSDALADRLAAALADDLPLLRRDGGFVRAGYDPNLDELRELQQDSRRFIAALQARYATETGCRTLRVKHNHMIGYFVEVPQNVGEDLLKEPWKETFVHRQTMAGAMRFSTVELGELESKIASAADRALRLELGLFDDMAQALVGLSAEIATAAEAIAAVDVTAALADLAARLGWTRPRIDTSLAFRIEAGRHPVVEAALRREGEAFIANTSDLSGKDSGRILLITGPNMGGKSTYLRQNALVVVLAQMGSFVPAREAHIGVVDRLFSRVGAADDLARGRSTFMVEMVETAAILNQATAHSLVILDEIGRGTATFDGLSIAWAAIEHLHEINRCRALFATHFHELTALAERLPRIANATLKVTEWNGDVVFLHEVVPGAADRSYGLQVARLAGLPAAVVERAKAILSELERSDRESPKRTLVDDLPLFAAPVRQEPARPAPAQDGLREALKALDPDQMTPREALDALYRLKGQL